mgnify:CR=1 FL=1
MTGGPEDRIGWLVLAVVPMWATAWITWGGLDYELHTPQEYWDVAPRGGGLVIGSAAMLARNGALRGGAGGALRFPRDGGRG